MIGTSNGFGAAIGGKKMKGKKKGTKKSDHGQQPMPKINQAGPMAFVSGD